MKAREHEALFLVSEILGLAAERHDDNSLDALALLNQTIAAWAERRIALREVHRNLREVHAALRRTPRRAAPGTFARIHEGLAFG